MIEKIVLDYLKQSIAAVYMEVPREPPDKFVLIERTGGSETNKIRSGTLAIQSYAPTLYEAAALNEEVKTLMDGITALPSVSSCDLNADYNYTDTASKRYRYQAVYNVVYF